MSTFLYLHPKLSMENSIQIFFMCMRSLCFCSLLAGSLSRAGTGVSDADGVATVITGHHTMLCINAEINTANRI